MPIKLGDDGYWVPYLMGRGRGSARVRLRDMSRRSLRARLRGMGRGSAGEEFRRMGSRLGTH